MRVIVKLEALEDCAYDYEYHHYLQGLIYNLIKGSEYSYLHDKKGYKFFCFSNIFPVMDLKKGDNRTLIISSPDDLFIERLGGAFLKNEIYFSSISFATLPTSLTFSLGQKT
ncbi:MAG: hypothetical protein ACUVWK_06900 [Nitrososphaerales archaeon]